MTAAITNSSGVAIAALCVTVIVAAFIVEGLVERRDRRR